MHPPFPHPRPVSTRSADVSDNLDRLAQAIHDRKAVLFAGAGLSMSAGLPSWRQLVDHLVEELGLDPRGKIAGSGYSVLAEYYRIRNGGIGPLLDWMKQNWKVSEDSIGASKLHEIVVGLDFPIIYTTNYDANLEHAFQFHGKEYVKVANAGDIAKSDAGATQIVKFHGDFESEESIVIGETDYLNRLYFDTPLDIKLRADALAKTVLFVGYSVSDVNIRLLLHRLWRTWHGSGCETDRPMSFAFMPDRDPVQEAVLGQWGITLISDDCDGPEQGLLTFLTNLKRRVDSLHCR